MKFLSILVVFFLLNSSAFSKDPIVFSPLPVQSEKRLYTSFKPMLSYLEKKLNKKILFNYNKDYNEVLNKFDIGELDLIFIDSLPYIELNQKCSCVVPIINFNNSFGKSFYTCSLVSFLHTQKRQSVALTQPLSTCGYLSVNLLLDNKLENYNYRYVGRDDLVALEVLKGTYDLGGMKSSIAREYQHLGLEEIAKTKPIPTFALIANGNTLTQQEIETIRTALLQASKEEVQTWGELTKYGVQPSSDSLYEPLKELVKEISIPQKGNF